MPHASARNLPAAQQTKPVREKKAQNRRFERCVQNRRTRRHATANARIRTTKALRHEKECPEKKNRTQRALPVLRLRPRR